MLETYVCTYYTYIITLRTNKTINITINKIII